MISIKEIELSERYEYNQKLLDFEKLFKYPFGTDYFTIDHGKSYYDFFDRLGKTHFFIAEEDNRILAVCVAILRELDASKDNLVWYICDLKTHPNYQGRFIIKKILDFAFTQHWKISKQVYAISMDKPDKSYNRVVKFIERLPNIKLEYQDTLEFYLLYKSQSNYSATFLENNNKHFLSLRGIKNLILESSGKNLEIMHLVTSVQKIIPISENTRYMVCCLQNSSLANDFKSYKIDPAAKASIVANFQPYNWDFIQSADI